MEQTRAYVPSATCVRVDDGELQAVAVLRDVHHVPAQRLCARARHGRRHPENQVRAFT